MERRFISDPVVVEKRDNGSRIVGYAAVFYRAGDPGTEFRMPNGITERIMPTAFNERGDVRALFNHDPSHLLGRLTAGTLKLSVDQRGLKYEIDMPDTSTGRDVSASIQRGDLTGSSFGFVVRKGGQRFATQDRNEIRELNNVELLDVGPVTFPAYDGSSVGMRSDGETKEFEQAITEWRREREAVAVRLRLLTLDEQMI